MKENRSRYPNKQLPFIIIVTNAKYYNIEKKSRFVLHTDQDEHLTPCHD